MIVCVLFVFGALIEYAGLLLKMKLEATRYAYILQKNKLSVAYDESNVALFKLDLFKENLFCSDDIFLSFLDKIIIRV